MTLYSFAASRSGVGVTDDRGQVVWKGARDRRQTADEPIDDAMIAAWLVVTESSPQHATRDAH